jgi:hypothetical protein
MLTQFYCPPRRGTRSLLDQFESAADDGYLVADDCLFNPTKMKKGGQNCFGGVMYVTVTIFLIASQFSPRFSPTGINITIRDFRHNDGSRRMLELAQEMEQVFPTYDNSGQRVTAVYTHYRRLNSGCESNFEKPECSGSCDSCSGKIAKAKCLARKYKCKGSSVEVSPYILHLDKFPKR